MRSIALVLVLINAGCAAPAVQSLAPAPEPSSPSSPSAASSAASPSTGGISRNEAVDLARDALRQAGEDWGVVHAQAGSLGQVRPGWEDYEWGRGLSADLRVWRVVLIAGELSAEVVIDFMDGSVYSSIMGIAN